MVYFPITSGFIGVFKGALYNHGTGSNELINKYLTSDSVTRSEIWVGTYNKDTGYAGMFCNRGFDNAYITLFVLYIDYKT